MAKRKAGAPKGNKNAEKWTLETATALFNQALDLSYDEQYDFIGIICKKLMVSHNQLHDLMTKFPDLKHTYEMIKDNCAVNCFQNAKTAKNQSIYILNLKSNHKWTDRIDTTNTHEIKPFNIKDLLSFDDDE